MKLVVFALLSILWGAYAYDYVIVGGGTGGLTVANRLAEDSSVSVAVIEAGFNAEHLPEVFIPGRIAAGISFTTLNWAYPTTEQNNLNHRRLKINAGKALGGSTVINAMIWPRAPKEQYDAWSQLNDNDPSWTWNSLLPFFIKSEKFTPPNPYQTNIGGARYLPEFHGSSGRVKVGFPNYFYPQATLWRQAAKKLGFADSPDLGNGEPNAVGVAPDSLDANNNTRCSAVCAYYTPVANRPNFHVITNATVTRILWKSSSVPLTAASVEYKIGNITFTADVGREVILAAGTIGSPKVLELSGIGNSTYLERAGVKVVMKLPSVGENLADHVHCWVNAFTNASITKDILHQNPNFDAEQEKLWFSNRTGLLSAAPRSLGVAAPSNIFNSTELADLLKYATAHLSDYARQFSNGNADVASGIEAQHKLALELYRSNKQLALELSLEPGYSGPTLLPNRPLRNFTTINNVLYAPLSRGRTHITSSNPDVPPSVDPAYWSHPLDVATHVAGSRLARKMLTTAPMDSIYQGEFEPGVDKDSNAKLENWMRDHVVSDSHETGSLAMLPRSHGGVVDTKLKVYGTANVRVADASVIPFPVSAHIVSTIHMIGERAANIIKLESQTLRQENEGKYSMFFGALHHAKLMLFQAPCFALARDWGFDCGK